MDGETLAQTPELVKQVHLDYFKAGADCGITRGYQATIPGLMENGYTKEEARTLIARSVSIFLETRDEWWEAEGKDARRAYPLCLAGILRVKNAFDMKKGAVVLAVFCFLLGPWTCRAQTEAVTSSINEAFGIPTIVTVAVVGITCLVTIWGGLKRIDAYSARTATEFPKCDVFST